MIHKTDMWCGVCVYGVCARVHECTWYVHSYNLHTRKFKYAYKTMTVILL